MTTYAGFMKCQTLIQMRRRTTYKHKNKRRNLKAKKERTNAGMESSKEGDKSKISKEELKSSNERRKTTKLKSKTKKKTTAREVKEDSKEEISNEEDLSSSDDNLSEDQDEGRPDHSSSSSSSDTGESGYDESTKLSIPGPDLIRGEGNVETSSSSDSSSSDTDEEDEKEEEEEEEELEHGWGELDKDAPRDDTTTTRLAVCNMDWDRVKARDILVLFNSFKPTGGAIKSVTIYPSEYGIERMKEEDMKGPLEMIDHGPVDEGKVDITEGDQYHREKLRKYQLQRLKYYYAVVECDSKATAGTLYEQCDGLEYQSSSTTIDLRFIPDDMTFDEHEPKDHAAEMPDANLYKPVEFRTTALHQSKVELTWDETDHMREKKTMEAFGKKDLEEADVTAYLASSSGEEDDVAKPAFVIEEDNFEEAVDGDDEDQISKYRSLLQGIDEKEEKEKEEKQAGLEISWEPGLKDTAEELVKKKMEGNTELTPWEKYLEKKKEKKRKKREDKKQTSTKVGSADEKQMQEEQAAFSDDELPAGVDIDDSFFKESLKDAQNVSKGDGGKKKRKHKKQESLSAEEMQEQEQKKAELELLMMDEDDDKQHFNLKDIMEKEKKSSKKRKRKIREKEEISQEDSFQINVKDPRFDAIYTSHHYSIDPSDSQYKKTKSMEALVKEKQNRRAKKNWVDRSEEELRTKEKNKMEEKKPGGSKKKDQELSMLVKSIKNKTQQYNAKKSKKDLKNR